MKQKKKKTTTSAVILANAVQRRLSMSSSLYLSKDRVQRVREGDNTQHPKTTIKNTPRRKKKKRVRSSNLRKKKKQRIQALFFYFICGENKQEITKKKRETGRETKQQQQRLTQREPQACHYQNVSFILITQYEASFITDVCSFGHV